MLKQRLMVWFPPDGDVRARTLQEALGSQSGRIEFWVRPAFMVLTAAPPVGVLSSAGWRRDADGLFLEMVSGELPVGSLRLAESWRGSPPELELGQAPPWHWRRGRLAWMDEEVEPSEGQWTWAFDRISGWKASESKV